MNIKNSHINGENNGDTRRYNNEKTGYEILKRFLIENLIVKPYQAFIFTTMYVKINKLAIY